MEIRKAANVLEAGRPTPEQLEKINRQTKSPLQAEEVYVFAVRLCDDQPDRDDEQFSREALEKLAPMFIGKTGILDHAWQTAGQMGRIFDTEVRREPAVCWLKAWVYMLRSEKTEQLIREIEGGIKKEVSVGCAVSRRICSVCGREYGLCEHEKGVTYDGRRCTVILSEPVDAYEFSFVAVPAQREAGVVKAAQDAELKQLRKEAAYGRQYRKSLQNDVVRLGLVLDIGLTDGQWRELTKALPVESLLAVKETMGRKAAMLFPSAPQLTAPAEAADKADTAFII